LAPREYYITVDFELEMYIRIPAEKSLLGGIYQSYLFPLLLSTLEKTSSKRPTTPNAVSAEKAAAAGRRSAAFGGTRW
jgi:hypothetical protein